jgi:type IV secretory pathway VirB4 component
MLESGKSVLALDPENEYAELAARLGGCFIDLMSGEFVINPLEPKNWTDGADIEETPEAFKKSTKLSQHVSFLKDFFRSYKDFADRHIDALEIVLQKLYESRQISDSTRFERLRPNDYPTLAELYALIESEITGADDSAIYNAGILRELLLGLHSMCVGAESRFFNGHTNVTSSRFIVFGVKNLLQASANVRNALLFNALSYMSDRLLNEGRTVASIDELYLFLTNPTAIEYIRSFMKRVRKKDSAVFLSSQNLEDFDIEGIRELTKPLFSIPTHAFLFNAGNIDKCVYMDSLQLEESEYNLIRYPQRGVCLYKCGNERYNLAVSAPPYKAELFGAAGGK